MNTDTTQAIDFPELDSRGASKKLIEEISKWKLEAKSEDNDRYFYHTKEAAEIESGEKYYVVGRKGSGKTAISEYLSKLSRHDVFSEKLTFKNFPFNELYKLENEGFTSPNQYITLWKYVIYSSICKMLARNENIEEGIREKLNQIYGTDKISLNRRIAKWVGKEFSLSLFGIGFKVKNADGADLNDNSWTERVDFLEDLITTNLDSSSYFVIFDELDEDYRNIVEQKQHNRYTALITSLFKAVQDVKTTFSMLDSAKLNPVIFLRDDIYEIIQDSDKNKWGDFKIDLDWNEKKIQDLVAFRITRALNQTATTTLPFDVAWKQFFGTEKIRMGTAKKKSVSSFDFITRSTYLRPRDLVKYLQACAKDASERSGYIYASTVRRVDTAFSNYLKAELQDELFAIIPDISAVFDTISHIGKWNFSRQEFERAYNGQVSRGNLAASDVGFVLQILFLFSVIGNARAHSPDLFRYQNREARFSFDNRIVVHRGLFKSLQIR